MTKSLMLSIQPKHLVNILNGKKTLELRKSVPKDFNGWVYIYVTKGKPYIRKLGENYFTECSVADVNKLNGKIVARFWFDEYTRMIPATYYSGAYNYTSVSGEIMHSELHKQLCLDFYEVRNYGKGEDLYAWHIKRLEIFDKPMELSDFYRQLPYPNNVNVSPLICGEESLDDRYLECIKGFEIKRPPQSWQYVYVRESKKNE